MRKIPIAKPALDQEDAQAAYDAVMSGWVTQGPRVEQFENKFAEYVDSKYAIAVSSCTTALHLALIVSEVSENDEVICPSMSFIATANAVRYVGATPVFAEVGEDYNLDLEDVKAKITPNTKAIILVHQLGMPGDIAEFQSLAMENGIKLIEDAACAIGSKYQGKYIGSHSDLVCFSFHPRKILTTGDGGMITTSDEKLNDQLRLLRQHGMSVNDRKRHKSSSVIIEDYLTLGYNYRLTDIQAAVGLSQLSKLDDLLKERRSLAENYTQLFSNSDCIHTPPVRTDREANFQSYAIRLDEQSKISRNELMQELLNLGISTRRGVMTIHQEPAYNELYECHLPKSEILSDTSIMLPLYPGMTYDEMNYVVNSILMLI